MSKLYTDDAPAQPGLPLELELVVVLRPRPDGRLEVRYPGALVQTYTDWRGALERLEGVCRFLGTPYTLRVRR